MPLKGNPKFETRRLIMEAIAEHGPMTMGELVDEIKLTYAAVSHSMRVMRKVRPKIVFIKEYWRSFRGMQTPVFALGNRRNAEKLPSFTKSELDARHRKRSRLLIRLKNRQRKSAVANPFIGLLR